MARMLQKVEAMIFLTGKKKHKGFLLIEAMVSVSILAIGLLLILGSFTKTISVAKNSSNYFKAGLLLEKKMNELYSSYTTASLSEGVFDDFGNEFSWYLNTSRPDEAMFREIELRVSWKEKNKEQFLSVSTIL